MKARTNTQLRNELRGKEQLGFFREESKPTQGQRLPFFFSSSKLKHRMPPQTADGAAALHGEWRGVSAATVVPGSPSSYTQYDRTCSHLRAPTFPLSSRVFGALSQRLPGADGSPSLVRQFVREELRQKNYHLADLRSCDSGGAPGQPVLGNTLLHVPAVDTNRGFSDVLAR